MPIHRSSTSIKYLLKKSKNQAIPISKEAEPLVRKELPITEPRESVPEKRGEQVSPTENTLEIIPEIPTVDEELQEEGVEVSDPQAIFIQNKKVQLPMELSKVDSGLHQPITSGFRWLAELTKYILAKFHLVIKRVGGQLKIIEQG